MSNDTPPGPEFWARADEVIDIANKQSDDSTSGKVSASLLYAAARFSSFSLASSAKDVEEMKRNVEEAIQYFSGQFEKMLIENIDDYVKNFDSYTLPKENGENT
jgi:hypothetical protein